MLESRSETAIAGTPIQAIRMTADPPR